MVLAAGRSERLSRLTSGRSKAVLPLGGVPLVERAVRTLRDAGVERIVVVVGYQAGEVGTAARLAGGDVEVVRAEGWEAGNGASLAAAEPHLRGERAFLLLCGDHAFSTRALVPLAEAGGPAALIDESPDPEAWGEGTRVSVEEGRITAFGKSLPDPAIDWDIDTPDDLRLAKHRVRHSLAKRSDGPVSRWLNRPISTRITMAISAARIPPAVFSIFTALVGLWAAWSLSASRAVVGGVFVQAASMLDGVDGETARLQWRTSKRGALLDDLLDRMVDAAIVAGLGLWLWDDPSRLFRTLIIGATVLAWPLVHLAVRKPFQVFEVPPSGRRPLLVVLGSRDIRLLIVAGLSVADQPWIALGAGTAAYAISILGRVPFALARAGRGVARRFRPLRVFLPAFLRRNPPSAPAPPDQVGQPAHRDLGEVGEEPEHDHRGDDLWPAPPG